MNQALVFLLETFLGLFALALLLRFYLQAVRAPARNPLSQFLAALTDFMVRPARRVIPGLWGYDMSTLLLAWAVEVLLIVSIRVISGVEMGAAVGASIVGLILLAVVNLLKRFLYILIVAVIAQAILSWVNPRSPAMSVLVSLTRPFLRPFQRRIPTIGGVDISPLLVLVLCQLLLFWPIAPLIVTFSRML
jgi:YggT family protein